MTKSTKKTNIYFLQQGLKHSNKSKFLPISSEPCCLIEHIWKTLTKSYRPSSFSLLVFFFLPPKFGGLNSAFSAGRSPAQSVCHPLPVNVTSRWVEMVLQCAAWPGELSTVLLVWGGSCWRVASPAPPCPLSRFL